jgi:hypothetical protein
MHKTIAAAAVAVLAGCASTPKPTTLADGSIGQKVNCNGTVQDWGQCYEAAAKVCPGGINVVDREGLVVEDSVRRTLFFRCK